jgi:hypothetical protein
MLINSLIICRSAQRRSLLQQGMIEQPKFDQVKYASAIEDFVRKFVYDRKIQIIFISPEYTKESITSFIGEACEHPKLRNAAFIMLVDWEIDNDGRDGMEMWKGVGFDGFLVAPYTINSLNSIADLGLNVVREKTEKRKRESINSFLDIVLSQLNLAALNRQTDNPNYDDNLAQFKKLAKNLTSLKPEDYTILLGSLINLTTNDNSSRRDGSYYGSSQRLKKKYEQSLTSKIKNHLEKGELLEF